MYDETNDAVDHWAGKKTVNPFRRQRTLNTNRVIHEMYGCNGDLCVSSVLGTCCAWQACRNLR